MVQIQDVTEEEASNTKVTRRNVGKNKAENNPADKSSSPNENDDDDDDEVDENEGEEENTEETAAPDRELTFDEQVDQARAQYQPTAMEKFMALAKSLILRALVIYFIMSFIRGSGSKGPATNSTTAGQPPANVAQAHNVYQNGTEFDMYVYITEDINTIVNFSNTNAQLIWKQEGLIYSDQIWWTGPNQDGTISHNTQVQLSKKARNNGTLYIHTYFVPVGYTPNHSPNDKFAKSRTVHSVKQLNKFKKRRYAKTHNLITGQTSASLDEQEKAKVMSSSIESHWHPNITINAVVDWTPWVPGSVPAPLNEYVKFLPSDLKYQPVLFFNDYWNLAKDYYPINETTPVLPITVTFQPLSLFKWQIYASQSVRSQWQGIMGDASDDEDQDALKEAILQTNPYLLGLTFVISILHSVFEFLAFKNDIQFWNNRKSLEGLSVRSVFFNVVQSVIVLLYIMDNETNFMIRMSVFAGLLIEVWKINKVMDVKIDKENRFLGVIPRLTFKDKGSYVESSTRQYDVLAFRYLGFVLFPLFIGYSIYSLIYLEHKGYYSFVLSMLYGFLLTFGFIMMTPQLFINYKLKSVAHLPWRMLSYKFLNTFIDDLFSFIITTPLMYKIGTLRDDIIFLIYLYQRYIYRTDPTRVNEFGYSGEELSGAQPVPPVEGGETPQKSITGANTEEVAAESPSSSSSKKSKISPVSKKQKKVQ